MSRYRNTGSEAIAFRDDAPGKHTVEPGEEFEVVGDQHVAYVLTLPGVVDAAAFDEAVSGTTQAIRRSGVASSKAEAPAE